MQEQESTPIESQNSIEKGQFVRRLVFVALAGALFQASVELGLAKGLSPDLWFRFPKFYAVVLIGGMGFGLLFSVVVSLFWHLFSDKTSYKLKLFKCSKYVAIFLFCMAIAHPFIKEQEKRIAMETGYQAQALPSQPDYPTSTLSDQNSQLVTIPEEWLYERIDVNKYRKIDADFVRNITQNGYRTTFPSKSKYIDGAIEFDIPLWVKNYEQLERYAEISAYNTGFKRVNVDHFSAYAYQNALNESSATVYVVLEGVTSYKMAEQIFNSAKTDVCENFVNHAKHNSVKVIVEYYNPEYRLMNRKLLNWNKCQTILNKN